MATPKPGEIRCPTCHRSTPPAAFCTQCGSAIPSDARIRPRGMDRDELQERIRARRSGGDPYRRGGPAEDLPGYERYEPEPEDTRGRQLPRGDDRRRDLFDEAEAPPRRDLTRDDDDWAATVRPSSSTAAVPTPAPAPPPPAAPETIEADRPANVDNFDDAAYADDAYTYEYDDWEDTDRRRSGGGALAILGFLALGVLALIGGALLAGVFNEDPGVGQNPTSTPIASASASARPTASATLEPTGAGTPAASPGATGQPTEPGEPVEFPDGFVVSAQPCLPGSAGTNGCESNAQTNAGSLWAWVGFQNGTANDVIGAELIGPDGASLTSGSIDLADIGCQPTCPGGWTYFPYSNLQPGAYEVRITRNGEPAGTMTFEVT